MKNFKFKAAAALISAAAMSSACSLYASAEVTPDPVISRNVPAYSEGNPDAAKNANDEHYFSFCFLQTPDCIAYDLSSVPEEQRRQVIAVWYNASSYDAIGSYISRNMEPSDYTVEVNSAPGGEYPSDGWEIAVTVKGNTLSSRQHLIDMEGCNWIRLNISAADGEPGKQASVNFDVHSVSDGVSDSWLFLGDSITAGGMNNCYGTGFATFINQLDSRYFPIQENGGIGGITAKDGRENIDRWLANSPAHFVSIAYGTNDSWGGQFPPEVYYENTKYMIDAVLTLGKVPVLPKIPYSTNTDVLSHLEDMNAVIDRLWEEYGDKLVHGPDFYAYFSEHPDNLSDGVHPDSEGYEAMRKLWAETMYENVYKAQAQPSTGTEPLRGDANCDGQLNMADAVYIMQCVSNPDKYKLSETGELNADVDGIPGITNKDALVIQMFKLGLSSQL